MTAGDSNEWHGFISSGGVETVLSLVVETWERMAPPDEDELEERTSLRLYAAMLKARNRQVHRFLIRYEDVEVDTDLAKETGRKDIVFFPGHNGDFYYCLEAKRLNARVKGVMKSLADEYVKEGLQRFAVGKYSRHVDHAGMVGYVLDGDISRAMTNVLNNIRQHQVALGMSSPANWEPCPHRIGDSHAKETRHKRVGVLDFLYVQHLFVAAAITSRSEQQSSQSPTKQRPRRKTKSRSQKKQR
jgi:hypothetical protein